MSANGNSWGPVDQFSDRIRLIPAIANVFFQEGRCVALLGKRDEVLSADARLTTSTSVSPVFRAVDWRG